MQVQSGIQKKNLEVEVGKTLAKPLRNVGCLRKTVRTSLFGGRRGPGGGGAFGCLLVSFVFLLGRIHLLSLRLRELFC